MANSAEEAYPAKGTTLHSMPDAGYSWLVGLLL